MSEPRIVDFRKPAEKYRAVVVEYDYEVDTGDECKGVRIEGRTGRGVLFEGPSGVGRVLFLPRRFYEKEQGEFYALTGKGRGSRWPSAPELEYHSSDAYDRCAAPETALREIEKVEGAVPVVVEFVLQIPINRRRQQEIMKTCLGVTS